MQCCQAVPAHEHVRYVRANVRAGELRDKKISREFILLCRIEIISCGKTDGASAADGKDRKLFLLRSKREQLAPKIIMSALNESDAP